MSFDDSELYLEEEEEEEDWDYELSEEKASYNSSTTPQSQSRCSSGFSTETNEFTEKKPNLVKKEQSLLVRSDSSKLTI
ncbi:unnamed protein product [Eruca vesicaria subsp. sativa]|uniref:Uncharacterized protein n=1 Tax=Eruca vesicaria subsp. sativa TaxID=29727 RepID=A0ABC8IPL6_ERUVS|nr:unnamed protein product [Eruca vesicaria subsp. sativa]